MRELREGTCQICGDYGLTLGHTYKESYCGDCAPADLVEQYIQWWNSPASARYRTNAAREALTELLAEQLAEQNPTPEAQA